MSSPADIARRQAFRRQLLKFADERVPGTCGDLEEQGSDLAAVLANALEDLRAERYDACVTASEELRASTWNVRSTEKDSTYGGGGSQWPHVSYREAHVFSLLFLGCAYASAAAPDYGKAVEALDTSVMLSGMLPPTRSMLQYCEPLAKKQAARDPRESPAAVTWTLPNQPPANAPSIQYPIATLRSPDQETFGAFVTRNEPLKMTGALSQWQAICKWSNLEYLVENYGHRHIPVEIGRHGSGVWIEEVMRFSRLLVEYMAPCNAQPGVPPPLEKVAYLAQHPLFEHIPNLRHDIAVPHYAKQFLSTGEPHINTWIGTAGTVTPLHTDSYDNILAQVAGFKYVRLYDQAQTPYLYVDDRPGSRGNMSLVECENEDMTRQPLAAHAVYSETILGPGDCLFIPRGCWHYVRSLTASASVNFWFT